jgi:hypothetical protein
MPTVMQNKEENFPGTGSAIILVLPTSSPYTNMFARAFL